MKNIFKILTALLLVPFVLNSCRNEYDDNWTTPEASFTLNNPAGGTSVLYPTMKDNPYILSWQKVEGASDYTVEVSATEDFKTPVELGKSTANTLKTTIGTLNDTLLKAGFAPYTGKMVYLRVKTGTAVSNVVSFSATPYPSSKPVITAPAAGAKLILDATKPDGSALKMTWNDYSYGTDVVYNVEIAKKGEANYLPLGTVNNIRILDITTLALEKIVLRLGGTAGVAADYNVRVSATTKSVGGTLVSVSDPVTISVTPYKLESYIYALGGFNNWSHDAAEILTSATSNGIFVGYINFPAAGTEFKITEGLNWDVNYGDNGGDGTIEQNGDNIKSPAAGYHKITVDLNAKTITLVPEVWGIIGSATPNSWDTPDTSMVWSSAKKTWEATVNLTVGELKFRRNNDWGMNYGDDGTNGSLEAGGKNIPVTAAGTYKVVFDEINLTYTLTKL